jgi:putative ABC transport system substrate-binding protein
VLAGFTDAEFQPRYTLFRDALAQLGWTEPRNLRIDYRSGISVDMTALRAAYAKDLVGLAPDVIFADPGPEAEAVQRLTRSIPIVFITATDPVEAGYVQSYAHPGGNMTGFTNFEISINSKWLQLLKEAAPSVTRVAVLHNVGNARARRDFEAIEASARSFGVTPIDARITGDDAAGIAAVINAFARELNGGLIVPPSNIFLQRRELIVMLADRYRLPAIYNERPFVDAGGLMSYGADRLENYPRSASYVDRILRGAKPGDLSVQAPTKYELVVNLKAAKSLGLTMSGEFLLTAADVVE